MNSNWSYSPETPNAGQNWRLFMSRVTLKFGEWPSKALGHLFYTSSFVHHFKAISEFKLELQSTNTQFVSKSVIFLSSVTYKFDWWPRKTIGHLFYATSHYVHHFKAICEFKLELQSGNGWIRVWPLWPWHLTLTFVMDITLVHGNNSWKFHDDMMTGT